MSSLILATKNPGKTREFKRILEPLGFTVLSQADAGLDIEVDETGSTFAENAALKARAIYTATGCLTVGEDSGLAVDWLDGRPGIYSARYGGAGATDDGRNALLLQELRDCPRDKRTARYVCAICCIYSSGEEHAVSGTVEGWIGWEPQGTNGFGYDPIFMVGERSFAEFSAAEKDAISHRARAIAELRKLLTTS